MDSVFEIHDPRTPLYYYTSAETAKIILRDCTLRFSSPKRFNDPFEFHRGLIANNTSMSYLRETAKKALRRHFPDMERASMRKYLKTNVKIGQFNKATDNIVEELRCKTGIFCSSEANNITLMWSHYADKHKGVCIGLRMPGAVTSLKLLTNKVRYVHTIEPYKLYTDDDKERMNAFNSLIFTKSAVWSYEKEVRSFVYDKKNELGIATNGFADIPTDETNICEIYYGVSTTDEDHREIESIISNKGYGIQKRGRMMISKNTFNLIVRPI